MILRPEQSLHRAAAEFLDLALPAGAEWWHTPNGGGRSRAEGGIFKKTWKESGKLQ